MKNEKSAENAAKKKVMTDEQTEMLLDQLMEKPKKQKTKQTSFYLVTSFYQIKRGLKNVRFYNSKDL